MDFLPINIRIADRTILIVGGGRVATHKAQILNRFTDKANVIAPEISDEIKALPFQWTEKAFEESDLDGVSLLFVCTGDHGLNRTIKSLATQRGILTSVCDAPELCDFTSPAIYRHENLTIAVASDARDVKRSIRIRNNIQKAIEHDSISID
ncbi:MAG: bifunctional precorrin-2 dehydrogenase/sirohydrochlorin ferrochelatase [Bacteroidaceae bacterium]|nr:bifunctional precorrin-2 dehydrogenase/sirohydrochlorin ferrochelatase [Bacteroidaceae bacterium]